MKTTPRVLIAAYLAALMGFVMLDACWLMLMGARLYQPALGALMAAEVDWPAAALFYVVYAGGLLAFAVMPSIEAGRTGVALRRGALMGFVAYATYDLTNQATLRGWPWAITLADLAWGVVVSGSAAWLAARLIGRPASRTSAR